MKQLWKAIVTRLATVIVLGVLLLGGIWYVKSNLFGGSTQAEYRFVVKRLVKKRQLLVADATVDTQATKQFNADLTKDWPEWMTGLADILVSRKAQLRIPVKTEFKIELADIDKSDITIDHRVIRFKKPLTIYVDSQKAGEAIVETASTGLIDKAVDVVTGSRKALEFLEENSQEVIYETSDTLIRDRGQREKVVRFAEEALEEVLNLQSDKELTVELTSNDLIFKNHDSQK